MSYEIGSWWHLMKTNLLSFETPEYINDLLLHQVYLSWGFITYNRRACITWVACWLGSRKLRGVCWDFLQIFRKNRTYTGRYPLCGHLKSTQMALNKPTPHCMHMQLLHYSLSFWIWTWLWCYDWWTPKVTFFRRSGSFFLPYGAAELPCKVSRITRLTTIKVEDEMWHRERPHGGT